MCRALNSMVHCNSHYQSAADISLSVSSRISIDFIQLGLASLLRFSLYVVLLHNTIIDRGERTTGLATCDRRKVIRGAAWLALLTAAG